MSSIRKLVAYALGHNTDVQSIAAQLEEACVPVSTDDCRGCADPCDEGHEEYPRFDVDMETQLLGSMKPYRRQVVISTGKSDWAHEVTSTSGTLAAFLDSIAPSGPKGPKGPKPASPDSAPPSEPKKGINGIYDPSQTKRIAILNGSHHTVCEDSTHETVLVLPDYKVVTEVERSKEGAQLLWREAVDPALGRTGAVVEGSPVRSWVLPYSCVILLCSHKKRDNRCALAAPKLEHGLSVALEREGWEVHQEVEDPAHYGVPPLEEFEGTEDEKDQEILRQLKSHDSQTADTKRALILKISHIGGHKYAGNLIIYTPQGASVWYGRATPHHVDAIVRDTIVGGKVIPPLLRGGLNLSRPGRKSLNDW